uniref:Centrosomin N-terminal motif 1 domain-containing protein n=1 Tax=Athene cunicularia TaxID=194338 RepID=A0A663LQ79_ATHCN
MCHPSGWPAARWAPRHPGVPPGDISEAGGAWSSCFAHLTAARSCSLPASQDRLWGEGDEDLMLAEPGGSHGPPGAQPQPGPLVQTCLLQDLEMGPLAQTQTLRDFEQVRPWSHLNDLKKENFSLKLRIYFLEERVQQKGEGSRDDVYRRVSARGGQGWVPGGCFLPNALSLWRGAGAGRVSWWGCQGGCQTWHWSCRSCCAGVFPLLP